MSAFGFGEWTAYTAGQGGSPVNLEMAWTSISTTRVVNGAGSARVNIPQAASSRAPCCEVVAKSEPWRDEVILYRDNDLAFAGPLRIVGGLESPNCLAEDLFTWMSRRFLDREDLHFAADVADIFRGVFEAAMEPDTTPNISITTRSTGVRAVRDYLARDLHSADGVLNELAKTALDFTMVGRTLVAGGKEVFLGDDPLLLHDDGCITATPIKDGSNFANDIAVLGATLEGGDEPINGRATIGTSVYGLVQKVVTELLIRDQDSANANARSRVQSMQPVPQRLNVVFSPQAAFRYEELIPGRRIDVRLAERAGCMEVNDTMRIVQVNTEVRSSDREVSETVSADLVPLGLSED